MPVARADVIHCASCVERNQRFESLRPVATKVTSQRDGHAVNPHGRPSSITVSKRPQGDGYRTIMARLIEALLAAEVDDAWIRLEATSS